MGSLDDVPESKIQEVINQLTPVVEDPEPEDVFEDVEDEEDDEFEDFDTNIDEEEGDLEDDG